MAVLSDITNEFIRQEIEEGAFPWREELEDIHMNIEARLEEKIGELAGKLHTARSRNDQVALDMRLFVKEAIEGTVKGLQRFQEALLGQAIVKVNAMTRTAARM